MTASPASVPLAVVPFARHGGLVFLPVRANGGRTLNFVLETGAVPSVLDRDVAAALGIETSGGDVVSGAGAGAVAYALVPDATLEVASVRVRGASLIVAPLRELGRHAGCPVDGLLGLDFLRRFTVVVDFDGGTVALYDPSASGSGRHAADVAIPVGSTGGHLTIAASVLLADGRAVPGTFALDTGAGPTAILAAPFVRRHSLLDAVPCPVVQQGRGIAGDSRVALGRPAALRLGDFIVPQPVCGLSTDTAGAFAAGYWDGVLGNGLWERFTLTLDLARDRVLLRPSARFGRREAADASGLALRAGGQELRSYVVARVAPDSPAARAGMREGDELLSLDGRPASELSLTTVRESLQRAGHEVQLTVRRGGAEEGVRLGLRELV